MAGEIGNHVGKMSIRHPAHASGPDRSAAGFKKFALKRQPIRGRRRVSQRKRGEVKTKLFRIAVVERETESGAAASCYG